MTQPWFVSGDGNSLSQTLGVPGVRWPRASLALAGGTPGGKPCAEMGLVFMLEADEQVTSLFLFRGFSSTSESHSDGKAQFSLVGRVQLVPVFSAFCFPASG